MANSLEVRSPFVDHKLIEYMLSLNSDDFIKNQPKFLLKKYLSEDFSNDFLNREKKGFVFDIENWIYINQDIILSTVNDGKIIKNLNNNVVNALLKVKSRANAIRLWKIFVLEKYIEGIKKMKSEIQQVIRNSNKFLFKKNIPDKISFYFHEIEDIEYNAIKNLILFFKDLDYEFSTIDNFNSKLNSDIKLVSLTFDDGFKSWLRLIDLFDKYEIKSTFYKFNIFSRRRFNGL